MTVLDPRKAPKFTKHAHTHDGHADAYHSDDDHEVDGHHHHHHGPAQEGKVTTKVKVLTLMAVVLPPIALAIAIYYSWGGYFSWTDMAMLVVGYFMTSMGITIGYHRLYTHKSFEASAPVAWVSAVCGSMAVQGPLLWWVTTHRRHHQHSDHELDPHSPHAGRQPGVLGWIRSFGHSHIGWLFSDNDIASSVAKYAPDVAADKRAQLISKLFPLWVLLGFAVPALIGGLVSQSWMGAFLGFLWGGVIRMFLVHHATWSVNSVCHIWGSQTYRSGDHSRNNPVMGILAMGEGWHNNHHAFPASARHGLRWYQFDLSWITIRTLGSLGLVTRIRLPGAERMKAKQIAAA
jgi:stearoyl-CoA desaturase (delta-9 desaturase)